MKSTAVSNTAQHVSASFKHTDWKEKTARIGHGAKGIVYGIAGVLTLLAAFNLGGENAGKTQVIDFLQKQAFGNVLVVLMAVGLACYAFFRYVQVTGKSPELQEKSGFSRVAQKIAFAISGLLYLGFSVYAVMQITGGNSGDGNSQQGMLTQLMSKDWGVALVYVAAVLLLIKAISQFVKVAKQDYYDDVRGGNMGIDKAQRLVKNAGAAGLIARGVLIAITAYLCYQAAAQRDASEIQGSSGAFSFLEQSTSGPWLVATIAIGLVCYAIYMFIIARYKNFRIA